MRPEQFDRLVKDRVGNGRELSPKTGTHKKSEAEDLKQRLRSFWNGQQCYWDLTSSGQCVESPERQRAASYLPVGEPILDIACGTAANSAWLKERCRYFGVDLSITALKRPIDSRLHLTCGDADHLPFRNDSFGGAVATYVLEHAVEPTETLREMCRVVRPGGRIVLLGPAWDFPFWFPNSLRSRAANRWWRVKYTLNRLCGQLLGWSFGRLPFENVKDPDAFHSDFIYDADAVYIVWTYEIIRMMKHQGHKLIHWETDDQLLGTNPIVRWSKRILLRLPIYRYAGSLILLVFEK
jgi:SAM-dependent methyltransferase